MERRPYRYYSTEFKLTVVQAYLNGEGGLKAIARQFDIHHPLLIKWVRKFELGELTEELAQEEKCATTKPKSRPLNARSASW
jgi:transposase-like protein